jgi:Leucine Rich repeat
MVTDAGLKHLSRMTQLETLDLRETKITDAGLTQLYGLQRLQTLGLQATKVTPAGIQQLRKALPGLQDPPGR